jgi:hypothetical protein
MQPFPDNGGRSCFSTTRTLLFPDNAVSRQRRTRLFPDKRPGVDHDSSRIALDLRFTHEAVARL